MKIKNLVLVFALSIFLGILNLFLSFLFAYFEPLFVSQTVTFLEYAQFLILVFAYFHFVPVVFDVHYDKKFLHKVKKHTKHTEIFTFLLISLLYLWSGYFVRLIAQSFIFNQTIIIIISYLAIYSVLSPALKHIYKTNWIRAIYILILFDITLSLKILVAYFPLWIVSLFI